MNAHKDRWFGQSKAINECSDANISKRETPEIHDQTNKGSSMLSADLLW